MKRTLVLAAMSAALSLVPACAARRVVIMAAPRAALRRRRSRARPGYVWTNGYWDLRGSSWAWSDGRWMRRPRPRAVWGPGNWLEVTRGHWRFERGHWR